MNSLYTYTHSSASLSDHNKEKGFYFNESTALQYTQDTINIIGCVFFGCFVNHFCFGIILSSTRFSAGGG